MSGDALLAMRYVKRAWSASKMGKGMQRERSTEDDAGEGEDESSRPHWGKSSIALRPSQEGSSPAMSDITLRPADLYSNLSGFGTAALDRPALEASVRSVVPKTGEQSREPSSKFFFAKIDN